MNQQFIGEHLLPGNIGQFLIVFGFISALFTAFSYFISIKKESALDNSVSLVWERMAKVAYLLHVAAIVGVFITLYYIISNHLFEYHYAWRHSSRGLQTKYLWSCFWEGSEGSFLLWTIWQALLGLIVLFRKNALTTRVMVIVALAQALVCTMLLGIYLTPDIKIGSTPFTLLRNEMQNAPIFQSADYLKQITDGRGLNPLLQNYWMVIHPPVLFLGFALTLFPFAYCIAAMWKNDYKTFIKPALGWALATGGILGLGIMMGGAWAYESLNFGGYWAWDPVENASLVPWLIMVAALHSLLIYKSTKRALRVGIILFLLSFIFVWYSTFLTRTGVLGQMSVHAFTDAAKFLYWHLLIVIGVFVVVSLFSLIRSWKKMPRVAGEEGADSREFWMLIGSIFLFISALLISMYTSLPVWAPLYNKITGTQIAPPEDPIKLYNNIQVWFGIIIAGLSGGVQFLKYKKTDMKRAWKELGILAGIALLLTVGLVIGQDIKPFTLHLFAFTIIFTIIANLVYLFRNQKAKIKKAGAAITHFGFGLLLLGVLLSGYGKQVISLDNSGKVMDYGKKTFEENAKESRENVLVFRNTYVPMGDFMVSYLGDSFQKNDPPITYYKLKFDRRDKQTNKLLESFILKPDVIANKDMEGGNPNPDKRHYLTYDIYTYISGMSKPEENTDTLTPEFKTLHKGDTLYLTNGYLVFQGFNKDLSNKKSFTPKPDEIAVGAILDAYTIDGKVATGEPIYVIDQKNGNSSSITDTIRELGTYIAISKINPKDGSVEFGYKQRSQQDDYIVMKAIIFPYIGLLWIGVIIMVFGFILSLATRK